MSNGSLKMTSGFVFVIAVLVAACAFVASRGPGEMPGHTHVYPVMGKLFVNGQPAAHAMIAFHPLGNLGSKKFRHVAATGQDGTYRLMTFTRDDGAPAGNYAVTILWPDTSPPYDECGDVLPHDRLKGLYADATTTPLKVTIAEGTNELPLVVIVPGGWSVPRKRDLLPETAK